MGMTPGVSVLATSLKISHVEAAHGIASETYTLTEANGRRLDQRSVAVEWEVTDLTNSPDWTENTTAEDNDHENVDFGQDGALNGTEGVVYNGPTGAAVRVAMTNIDVSEGTIVLEEEDLACVTLFKNSELVWYADEGFVTIEEGAVEFNMDTDPIYLTEGDVFRLCITAGLRAPGDGAFEDGVQLEIAEEVGEISITSMS